jgi:hypothetical protein
MMKRSTSIVLLLCALFLVGAILGCGGKTPSQPAPPPGSPVAGETTLVTPLLSSSANGQLVDYFLTVDSITLTSKSGTTVTLYNTPQYVEFIGLNGTSLPLTPGTIPQDVYTSVAVKYSNPSMTCLYQSQGTIGTDTASGAAGNATVTLASPLTVSGAALGLSLDLAGPQSTALPEGCTPTGAVSITPAFDASLIAIASAPTSNQNGPETGIEGRVISVATSTTGSQSFSLLTNDGSTAAAGGTGSPLTVAVGSNTAYQGISGFSALTANMFVDMDAKLQSDGSLLATRISVADSTALNTTAGILLGKQPFSGSLTLVGRQEQGSELSTQPQRPQIFYTYGSSTVFTTSGQFTNLTSLPFIATFNSTTLIGGQNLAVSSQTVPPLGSGIPAATTVTLMPQTLNGTVTAVLPPGPYMGYYVTLAPYDPISLYNSASSASVAVYVGSNTRVLTSAPVAVGSLVRVNGLLFSDGTALNMDCAQINDGVTE